MIIVPTNDTNNASFLADENTAIQMLEAAFPVNITVYITIGYGDFDGSPLSNQNISEGDVNGGWTQSYSQLRTDLMTAVPGFFNSTNLPSGSSIDGVSNFWVSTTEAKIFGIIPANTNQTDGFVGIGTGFSAGSERIAAFLHEIGHALGRVPENQFDSQGNSYFSALDLWRFTGVNSRFFNGSNPDNTSTYFSLDDGSTDTADWGHYSDSSDFLNTAAVATQLGFPPPYSNLTPNDPFDEIVTPNSDNLTPTDLSLMEALGFSTGNPTPAGTTAVMVLDQSNGAFEIYDLGNNAILGSFPLMQVASTLQFAGFGAFDGSDTHDLLLRDSNTGAFELYDIANDSNSVSGSVSMGAVGGLWAVDGFGDFSSKTNETDMLMQNSNSGALELYDISNNQYTGFYSMGQVGGAWKTVGVGDFSSKANETDMLMQNSLTGALELYDIVDNQYTGFFSMGQVGLAWHVVGVGDFSGKTNETDMMMRNSNTGAFEIYDIVNNQYSGFYSMGQVGLGWAVAGVGDFSGNANETDMLMRNTATGAFELYDISNNQYSGFFSLGSVVTSWQTGGIGSNGAENVANGAQNGAQTGMNDQFVQAIAGFSPNGSFSSGGAIGGQGPAAPPEQPFASPLTGGHSPAA